jgi:ABC-2 type transport system permease protein
MPLVLSVYVGFFSVMNDPHGTLAVVFNDSAHIAYCYADENSVGVPLWQIAISVSLLFATFFSVVWFAAKIYRVEFNVWKETYMERIIQMA